MTNFFIITLIKSIKLAIKVCSTKAFKVTFFSSSTILTNEKVQFNLFVIVAIEILIKNHGRSRNNCDHWYKFCAVLHHYGNS